MIRFVKKNTVLGILCIIQISLSLQPAFENLNIYLGVLRAQNSSIP